MRVTAVLFLAVQIEYRVNKPKKRVRDAEDPPQKQSHDPIVQCRPTLSQFLLRNSNPGLNPTVDPPPERKKNRPSGFTIIQHRHLPSHPESSWNGLPWQVTAEPMHFKALCHSNDVCTFGAVYCLLLYFLGHEEMSNYADRAPHSGSVRKYIADRQVAELQLLWWKYCCYGT
ncbi:hypothetical protein CIHG_07321 [Coccidioides immitis H538.4]|uniref:Uncharacterized protein n=3 Tax=Coccidioides immitis TaxID=5501 RepID=A0A0J8QU28_COCIT|nr:hypothetical protein CIRG_00655 [Coccidioides immitis RMSCC 2394]KMU75966.1 hypothetical protein CISG_05451 [Coccidioides immitis RMSCC 3703]KMU89514.1 hypothetical protein CIHG_07321 [Coccidioides immitis H538.4]